MKKYIYILIAIVATTMTSCLKSDLEDLPEFEENDITSVQRVEYRFISEDVSNASGQKIVKFVNLRVVSPSIDKDNKTATFQVTVPAANTSFTATEREKVSLSNLAVIVNLSTAARIFPIGDAPKLGAPGDWSKPNKYRVEAANGNVAEWTIEVTALNK